MTHRSHTLVSNAYHWFAVSPYRKGVRRDVDYYRHPPVDPHTGEVSADDDSISMGQMRHCDVPEPHRRAECTEIMDDHGWIDNFTKEKPGLIGETVCPGDWVYE